jgi:hypothetical protein
MYIRKTRYLVLFILMITLFNLVLNGCGGTVDQSISFSQLISQASKYNGKAVTLEAYYFGGFEISALSEALGPSSSAVWRIVPTGTLIWVRGGITQVVTDKLYTQTDTPSGYSEHMGKLKLSGLFETGAKYGQMDSYLYQITITGAEVLEWSPPPAATAAALNGKIQIKVTDPSGLPLQGAKVVSEAQPNGQLKLTGLSDQDGLVTFMDVKPGNYQFYVNRYDFIQTELAVSVTGGVTNPATLALAAVGQAADDIVITPSGNAYRANVHQQGVPNPWPSVETVEVPLGSGQDAVYLRYRSEISSPAGQTRNNILTVRKADSRFDMSVTPVVSLDTSGNPSGFTFIQDSASGLPGTIAALLKIEISSSVQPGQYALKIGLNIDGKDYGNLPCTLTVTP